MIRESVQEKIIKASLRAQFALKQRIERIKWEARVLLPQVNEFLDKATLPEPPSECVIDVSFSEDADDTDKSKS
jgi:hypothetical protein